MRNTGIWCNTTFQAILLFKTYGRVDAKNTKEVDQCIILAETVTLSLWNKGPVQWE